MLQEIIAPFIWSLFLSFVSFPLVSVFIDTDHFRQWDEAAAAGADVASQAPESRSISRVQEQTWIRGSRAGDKATREGLCGWWDTCAKQCAVPQLPEARGPSEAASSRTASY